MIMFVLRILCFEDQIARSRQCGLIRMVLYIRRGLEKPFRLIPVQFAGRVAYLGLATRPVNGLVGYSKLQNLVGERGEIRIDVVRESTLGLFISKRKLGSRVPYRTHIRDDRRGVGTYRIRQGLIH